MSPTSTTHTIKIGVEEGIIKNGEADMTTMEATGAPGAALTGRILSNQRPMAATSQSGWLGRVPSCAT